jgi:hypothetical protein
MKKNDINDLLSDCHIDANSPELKDSKKMSRDLDNSTNVVQCASIGVAVIFCRGHLFQGPGDTAEDVVVDKGGRKVAHKGI